MDHTLCLTHECMRAHLSSAQDTTSGYFLVATKPPLDISWYECVDVRSIIENPDIERVIDTMESDALSCRYHLVKCTPDSSEFSCREITEFVRTYIRSYLQTDYTSSDSDDESYHVPSESSDSDEFTYSDNDE